MRSPEISRRGVYYNLEISPHEFKTPCGDLLKFSSRKKLDIFTRKVNEYRNRVIALLDKHPELGEDWRKVTIESMEKRIYKDIYKEVEKG